MSSPWRSRALIALWLVSGQFGHSAPKHQATLAELNKESSASGEDKPMTRVRARVIHAEPQTGHGAAAGSHREQTHRRGEG